MIAAPALFRQADAAHLQCQRPRSGTVVSAKRGWIGVIALLFGLSIAFAVGAEGQPAAAGQDADVQASSIYALDTVLAVPDTEEDLSALAEGVVVTEPLSTAGVEIGRGAASWYGDRFHGRRTASGERFDMYALTAAHPTLPFGTRIKVRRLDTGQEIEVRINDRGPHARGRILDLSRGAAQALGVLQAGESNVALVRP